MTTEQHLIEALSDLVRVIYSDYTIPAQKAMPELLVAETLLEELT